jgi:translation initiation factor IF-1
VRIEFVERHERAGSVITLCAVRSGKMLRANIAVVAGDQVAVVMTAYDLHRGRIVYRL